MKEIFGCREDILNEFRASSFRLLYLPPLQCIGSAKLVLQNIMHFPKSIPCFGPEGSEGPEGFGSEGKSAQKYHLIESMLDTKCPLLKMPGG